MSPLPINLQGYIHVIQIPLEAGKLPSAFICYLRPKRIDCDNSIDIIDEKILEAIQAKFPMSTRITEHAIWYEQVQRVTAMFHDWNPFAISVSLEPNMSSVLETGTNIPAIPLSVYTYWPIERLSWCITHYPDDKNFDKWISELDPYMPLMDRIYPIETDNEVAYSLNTLPPVIDIRDIWENENA